MKVVYIVFVGYLLFLFLENLYIRKMRKKLIHVIHVNGTRGKSSVTRLIGAGLNAGGYKVAVKTTGTIPMKIDTEGKETIINRFAPSNIKEQMETLRWAVKDGADILVIECMALKPEYQYITQHKMLSADIGVITNVRLDHTEIMGNNCHKIAISLSNTIPVNGVLFTAEQTNFSVLEEKAVKLGTKPVLVLPETSFSENIDFPENTSLALEVCKYLKIEENIALKGMQNYIKDPFSLEVYRLKSSALFIAGLSINDFQSICKVYDDLSQKLIFENKNLILIINNRSDRATRTLQMAEVVVKLRPKEVWTLGSGSLIIKRQINNNKCNPIISHYRKAKEMKILAKGGDTVFYAIGNIGEGGKEIMEIIKKEAEIIEL